MNINFKIRNKAILTYSNGTIRTFEFGSEITTNPKTRFIQSLLEVTEEPFLWLIAMKKDCRVNAILPIFGAMKSSITGSGLYETNISHLANLISKYICEKDITVYITPYPTNKEQFISLQIEEISSNENSCENNDDEIITQLNPIFKKTF